MKQHKKADRHLIPERGIGNLDLSKRAVKKNLFSFLACSIIEDEQQELSLVCHITHRKKKKKKTWHVQGNMAAVWRTSSTEAEDEKLGGRRERRAAQRAAGWKMNEGEAQQREPRGS